MDPEKLALLKEKLKQDKFEFASVLVLKRILALSK